MNCFKLGLKGRYTLIICISIIGLIVMYTNLPTSLHIPPSERFSDVAVNDVDYYHDERIKRRNDQIHPVPIHSTKIESDTQVVEREWPLLPGDGTTLKTFLKFLKAIMKSDIDRTRIEQMVFDISEFLRDNRYYSKTSCKMIDEMTLYENLNRNNMDKLVNRALYDESLYVLLKSPGIDSHSRQTCLRHDPANKDCDHLISYNVLNEILYHLIFQHRAIVPLKGFCIRGSDTDAYNLPYRGIVMVMENGNNYVAFSKKPWRARAMALTSLAKLLVYFDSSPLGSVGLAKVTLDDFADFDGFIKFLDLDEVRLGEKKCRGDNDCVMNGKDVGILCHSGACRGLNAKSNIQAFCDTIFYALLENPPSQIIQKKKEILRSCSTLRVTTDQLADQFEKLESMWYYEEEATASQPRPLFPWQLIIDGHTDRQTDQSRREMDPNKNYLAENSNDNMRFPDDNARAADDAPPKPLNEYGSRVRLDALAFRNVSHYRMYPLYNMPSMNDYKCAKSRVLWGCLLLAANVDAALRLCDTDRRCKAFTMFVRSQENEVLSILLKNDTSRMVTYQDGVVLYVHNLRTPREIATSESPAPGDPGQADECLTGIQQRKSRKSREKQQLAILGLQGLSETEWQSDILNGELYNLKPLDTTKAEFKFLTNLRTEIARNVTVNSSLVLVLPNDQHLSHLIAYNLDRILGLFHVPPSVHHYLPNSYLFDAINEPWFQRIKGLIIKRYLEVVMTVQRPANLSLQQIAAPWLTDIPESLVRLSKANRNQVEHVMLMWLMKMLPPNQGYFGTSDHLIHFEADQSFMSGNVDWLYNYLHNCQFPMATYHQLKCLNCHPQSRPHSNTCSLGDKVMDSLTRDGLSLEDIRVGDWTGQTITKHLNLYGQKLAMLMDECIEKFGVDFTLYP